MKLKFDNFLNSTLRPWLAAENGQKPSLWIFGYGSLIWNPGFEHQQQARARLPGYGRRFYQGNTTYRGTVEQPGRVVTIIENDHEDTYGLAFKVRGWSQLVAALDHLHHREIRSGYAFRLVDVELLETGERVPALTCIALKENALFMPPSSSQSAPTEQSSDTAIHLKLIAFQIATASGEGGPNHEYLSKLADSMRRLFPDAMDGHLFQLEAYMLQFMQTSMSNGVERSAFRSGKAQAA